MDINLMMEKCNYLYEKYNVKRNVQAPYLGCLKDYRGNNSKKITVVIILKSLPQ